MSRTWRRLALLPVLLLLAAQALCAPRAQHVFIISFDGGGPAYVQQSKMPTVFSMARRGAVTWQAQTVFPSITLVSHTAMLTGCTPARNGVLWNDWEPDKGAVKVPTVFQLAKQKGLSTALFAGKEKFAHLLLPNTLDHFTMAKEPARLLADDAARYIVAAKPNLCFVHFTDTDSTGHGYGWGSAEQRKAFADEDAGVAIIRKAIERAGIAGDSVIILTADHGGHGRTHGSADATDMTIPWIAFGPCVKAGLHITAAVMTCDTTATALWLLDVPLPAGMDGKPVESAFKP